MKVVFIQDVPNVGRTGEKKEVADGYGRNFLLPKGLALLATPSAVKAVAAQLQKEAHKQQLLTAKLQNLAQELEGTSYTLKAKVATQDRLYGSIKDVHIAREISRVSGFDIDKKSIDLEEPICQVGTYEVTIRLAKDIATKVKLTVEQEKE
jgi:large subunit ribosomal protein L9